MKYFCYQLQDDDCGFACLKMLLANINNDKNYLYLQNYKDKGNYTFFELIKIANLYGVNLKGYKGKMDSKIKTPFICLIKGLNNNHYIIVYSNKMFVKYFDPDNGLVILPKFIFLKRFKGFYLEVESYINLKCNLPRISYFPYIPFFIMIFIGGFLIFISFFIESKIMFIIIFLLIILLEIISNSLLKNKVLKILYSIIKNRDVTYQNFMEISKNYVTYYSLPIKFVEKLTITFLCFFTIVNVAKINELILLIVLLIYILIIRGIIDKMNRRFSLFEKDVFNNNKSKKEYLNKFKKHDKLIGLITNIPYLILIIALLVNLFILKNNDIGFYIYSFIFFNIFNQFIECLKLVKKRNKYLIKVYQIINKTSARE